MRNRPLAIPFALIASFCLSEGLMGFQGGEGDPFADASRVLQEIKAEKKLPDKAEGLDMSKKYVGRYYSGASYDGYRYLELNADGTGLYQHSGQGSGHSGATFKWQRQANGWLNIGEVKAVDSLVDYIRDPYLRRIESDPAKARADAEGDCAYDLKLTRLDEGSVWMGRFNEGVVTSRSIPKWSGARPDTWDASDQRFNNVRAPRGLEGSESKKFSATWDDLDQDISKL